MGNETIEKFGYPQSLVREYGHWVVLLRPSQPTFGSLVLAVTSEATAYGELPDEAFAEQAGIVRAVERALKELVGYKRINYLMLMMVDPHVHFHIIPRYPSPCRWDGMIFPDNGWPGAPNLKTVVELDRRQISALAAEIRSRL